MTDVLPFEATKPDSATRKLFILNQNEEDLFGHLWIEAAANISWQAVVVIGDAEATFANEPADYTVTAGGLASVDVTLYSDGLNADAHPVAINVSGKTINSLRVEESQATEFTVTSYAFANNSRTEVIGDPPVMGLQIWGDQQVRIYPYDSDNQRIMSTNPGFDFFTVALYTQQGEQTSTVTCDVESTPDFDPNFHYYAKCSIPDLTNTEGAAGAWDLVAQLGGETVLKTAVDMWCPEDYYKDEGTCYECDVGDATGAICSVEWNDHPVPSGTTLEAIVLKKQYWRAHERSTVIYPCAITAACKGGDGGEQSPPEYCNTVRAAPLSFTEYRSLRRTRSPGIRRTDLWHLRARLVHVSSSLRFNRQRGGSLACLLHARRDHAAQVCEECKNTFSPERLLVFCVAVLCVVLLIGGAFLWLARLDKMRDKEHYRTGKQHAHIVQRKLGNKVSIVVFTFQVIYQYAGIVTGYESYFHYPEPANGAVSYMSMFGLEVLNFSPPEVSVAAPLLQRPLIVLFASLACGSASTTARTTTRN